MVRKLGVCTLSPILCFKGFFFVYCFSSGELEAGKSVSVSGDTEDTGQAIHGAMSPRTHAALSVLLQPAMSVSHQSPSKLTFVTMDTNL